MSDLPVRRGILLVIAAVAVTAVFAGLARMGVVVAWGPTYATDHGPMFALGVFGTVIALERAVALANVSGFLAPALGAASAIAMLARLPFAAWIATGSSVALVVVNSAIVRRQSASFTWLMLLGSIVLVVGEASWALGRPVFEVVPTWTGFFVLTITAERLELSRLAPTPRWASRTLLALAVVFALLSFAHAFGARSTLRGIGITEALIAAWQIRFDLARRTIRQRGLPRFAAVGVIAGAAWLLFTGVLLAAVDVPPAGPLYDAALHGIFVGYVLSMVFAHAPIILPAVARIDVPFSPLLYVPLAVLHVGLVARVVGDLVGDAAARQAGGIANGVALVLFAAAVFVARIARRD